MRHTAVLLLLGLVFVAGCTSGPPEPGAPVYPHPAGESAEVGGWFPVETLLVDSAPKVENPGSEQTHGWQVTVVSPSGPCPGDPMVPEKTVICVGLEISSAEQAGGLDLRDDLPLVVDANGGASSVTRLRIADSDWVELGQDVAMAGDCTFSAPDDQGRQQADCAAMVFSERSGMGEKDFSGWLTVGAGRTARYDLEYITGEVQGDLALWWPDGTWFALP